MSQPSFSSLTSSFGAILIGTYFSLILYGGILHQTYRYFQTYPGDRLVLKLLVLVVVLIESLQTAVTMYTCYFMLVTGYSNILALLNPSPILQILTLLSGIVVALTQAFFVRRAYLFGKQYRPWMVVVVILLVGQLGFSIASTASSIAMSVNKGGAKAYFPVPWIIACAAAISIAADSTLTAILILALRRSRSGMKSTDSMLDTLMLYTITTGLLTSAFMLLIFIFVLAAPNNFIYVAMSFVATKLYTNTLLAALNTRKSLRTTSGNLHSTGTEIFGAGVILELHPHSGGPRGENAVAVELSDLPTSQEVSKA